MKMKAGKKAPVAKEKEAPLAVDLQIKKLTDEMYSQKKAKGIPAKKLIVGQGRN